jgi:hypothetical protein
MPKYNNVIYAGGYYGQQSRLSFSVQPFTATTIDYDRVFLTWASLNSTFNAVRLVRNQVAFPETEEDGVILWEENGLEGVFSRAEFVDGLDNTLDDNPNNDYPLIGGRFAYYRMWLRKDDGIWYPAGDAETIIPSDHGSVAFAGSAAQTTHDKFMDLLPKVYTSATQSPLDNVDPESTLYTFLEGFSLTLDELLTYADVLKPNYSGLSTPPDLVPLQAFQLGLPLEYGLGLRAMKRLVREGIFLHNNKGTALGVQTLAESLTGFAPTVTQTKNLMLSMQDSTFYKGKGNWLTGGACTLAVESSVYHAISEPLAADLTYTAKVVASSTTSYISNGENRPKTLGIPVIGGESYQLLFFALTSTASRSITAKVTWYDYLGAEVDDNSQTFSLTANTWMKNASSSFVAPDDAAYASIRLSFSGAATFYLDMVQFALYEDSTPSYEEARGVNVSLAPSKTNLLDNPSFEADNTYWTIDDDGHTLEDSTHPYALVDSQMLESVTNDGAESSYVSESSAGVTAGQFYTASIYAKTAAGTEDVVFTVTATDDLDVTDASTDTITLTTTWQRLTATVFVPTTYSESTVLSVSLVGEDTTGNTIHLDMAQLEQTYLPTDYFDGSYPAAYGASWAGTANESVSYLYPNKLVKIPRLIANIAAFMPIGTPFSVSTNEGLEYVGIS